MAAAPPGRSDRNGHAKSHEGETNDGERLGGEASGAGRGIPVLRPSGSQRENPAGVADWRGMLSEVGFAIDDEGTKRGLAWILATRVCEPVAMPSAAPTKSALSRHLHCFSPSPLAHGQWGRRGRYSLVDRIRNGSASDGRRLDGRHAARLDPSRYRRLRNLACETAQPLVSMRL